MKLLRALLPNLTVSLQVSVLILLYLDGRNPMMGFLSGAPFLVLMILTAASSIACAVMVYAQWRKSDRPGRKTPTEDRKISNNT